MHILLFGGTSEGRLLAERLHAKGVDLTMCVATEYGASLLPEKAGIRLLAGRLDERGICALLEREPFDYVVDATHPYAVEVTRNVRAAAEAVGVPCLRLVREGQPEGEWIHVSSLPAAADAAQELAGNVLLTTGAKELAPFSRPGLRERCIPRVLPNLESLRHCQELGFPGAHILCMQGPFSKELNLALIRQYKVKVLVTKASGSAGGFWEKAEAAKEAGCTLIVVDRPVREEGLSLEDMEAFLMGGAE